MITIITNCYSYVCAFTSKMEYLKNLLKIKPLSKSQRIMLNILLTVHNNINPFLNHYVLEEHQNYNQVHEFNLRMLLKFVNKGFFFKINHTTSLICSDPSQRLSSSDV